MQLLIALFLATTVWDGVYTAPQAARGKSVYETQCGGCHAMDLSGNNGPALKGTFFVEHWREDNVGSLFTRVRTTMPPRNAGSLTENMYLDIVAYVLQANGYPVGEAELKSDLLNGIQIVDKDGPSAPPEFALVRMVGCFVQAADKSWILTNANEPVRTRNPGLPSEADLKASLDMPPGKDIYKLLFVDSFRTGFSSDSFKGYKMEAKGFLIQKPELRLSVTWLEPVAPVCQ